MAISSILGLLKNKISEEKEEGEKKKGKSAESRANGENKL